MSSNPGPSRIANTIVFVVAVVVISTVLFFPATPTPPKVDFVALRSAAESGALERVQLLSGTLEIRAWFREDARPEWSKLWVRLPNPRTASADSGDDPVTDDVRFGGPVRAAAPTESGLDAFIESLPRDGERTTEVIVEPAPSAWLVALIRTIPWILFAGIIGFVIWKTRRPDAGGRRAIRESLNVTATFGDVAGADEAKEEVAEVVEFLRDPERFRRLGGKIPRGVLLVGSPGTGKTLLARAVAGEAGVPFFSISGSDFVEMFVGVGASRVRELFRTARERAPAIVFLDEIDAVGRRRSHSAVGGSEEREQTLNAILVEMDGFDSADDVIVVAATNRPDVLDPALLRPGRFDREIRVDLPDRNGREQILHVHCKNVPLADDVDVSEVARGTPGFSGAELAALVNEAALRAALEHRDAVEAAHFEEARDKVRWGRAKKSRVVTEEDRRITAYHEAGHAILAHLLPEVEPLHKVTIVPRGPSLGSTMQLPESDPLHFSRERAFGRLVVLLGGRIAESRFGNSVTSGAVNDLERVADLARRMVCEWGMSVEIGPVAYSLEDPESGERSKGVPPLSERSRERIDDAIRALVSDAYEEAERTLEANEGAVERVALALLDRETLGREEVEGLVGSAAHIDTAWERARDPRSAKTAQSGATRHGPKSATGSA